MSLIDWYEPPEEPTTAQVLSQKEKEKGMKKKQNWISPQFKKTAKTISIFQAFVIKETEYFVVSGKEVAND